MNFWKLKGEFQILFPKEFKWSRTLSPKLATLIVLIQMSNPGGLSIFSLSVCQMNSDLSETSVPGWEMTVLIGYQKCYQFLKLRKFSNFLNLEIFQFFSLLSEQNQFIKIDQLSLLCHFFQLGQFSQFSLWTLPIFATSPILSSMSIQPINKILPI